MTNTVCLPVEIIRNTKLSPRARIVWAELSLLPKGAVGEFVVKHKELSQLLGICDSTLRRAVKALEEAGLIQCVGLFDKRFKKYVFKNCLPSVDNSEKIPLPPFAKGELNPKTNVDNPKENPPNPLLLRGNLEPIHKPSPAAVEKIPLPPFSKGELNPKTNGDGLLKSPLEKGGINPKTNGDGLLKSPLEKGGRGIFSTSEPAPHPITPFSNWQQTYKELKAQMKPEPLPEPKVIPSEAHLLHMKYRFANGKPCSDEKSKIVYAEQLYSFYQNQWRAQFPLLNGLDNRPLLDAGLIEYIIMNEPANIAGGKMMDIIDRELQRFTDFPIDRA